MPTTSDFKKHLRLLLDGEPFAIVEHVLQQPTARGGQTLMRTKLRNLLTGVLVEKTFKAGQSFEDPDVVYRESEFLYRDGEDLHFMDRENFEQFSLLAERVGDAADWLVEGLVVRALHFNGNVASIDLPQTLEVVVTETEPGVRGNTASGKVLKRAVVANGVEIQVPLYLEQGERIEVDPHERRFIRRAG